MKILASRYKLKRKPPEEDPAELAAREELARLENYIAERKKRLAEIDAEEAEFVRKHLRKIGQVKAASFVGKPHEKILFLPAGRVRSVLPPDQDVTVDDRFAARLNLFALSVFDQGSVPFLDLSHDYRTKIFEIAKFEFEPATGVVAYGRFTAFGRKLRDAGRISGVSPSIPVSTRDHKPLSLAFGTEPVDYSETSESVKRVPPTPENFANMGGVLVDGNISNLQPY
jgi:hypothetical protein